MTTYLSKKRLIVSNTVVEYYEYDKPYAYNQSPFARQSAPVSAEAQKAEAKRQDNLARTRNTIRRLVECNVSVHGYEPVFLTFTYAKNERDLKRAHADFSSFIRRFNRAYRIRAKYLAVIEFQGRGAIHFHCIFFNLSPTMEYEERRTRSIAKIWSHGFVDIERIRSAKRVGAYVCKYLDKSASDARLLGQNSFLSSKGLLKPQYYRSENKIDSIREKHNIKQVLYSRDYQTENFNGVKYLQYVI